MTPAWALTALALLLHAAPDLGQSGAAHTAGNFWSGAPGPGQPAPADTDAGGTGSDSRAVGVPDAGALAASDAGIPQGGTLRLAVDAPLPPVDPTLADSPAEAALRALENPPACRLGADGKPEPFLATRWELDEDDNITVHFATPAIAQAQAQAWQALGSAPSPYRGLLPPLRRVEVEAEHVTLVPAFPWPDLLTTLCHPALAARRGRGEGAGPYMQKGGQLLAQPSFVRGRPAPDRVTWRSVDARAGERLFTLNEVDGVLNSGAEQAPRSPDLRYATYLAFRPGAVGTEFRVALESALDRSDLAHYFARQPAAALTTLLPPPFMTEPPSAARAAPVPLSSVPRAVELLWDESLPDQRAVAERLQVKLHDLGYRVSLKSLSRAVLRQRCASGSFQLALVAALLPLRPAPAFTVMLELAGRHDLLPLELPALGRLDEGPRAERVRVRAGFLAPTLSLIPLYVQGTAVQLSPRVQGLTWDAQGLPRLDALWLNPAP